MNWKLAFAGTLAGALLATAAQQVLAEDVVIKVYAVIKADHDQIRDLKRELKAHPAP